MIVKYGTLKIANEARLIKLSKFVGIFMEKFSVNIFFQMIEIDYVPIYMKINQIFFVIKGQFPVMDYIPNTIILYFIVHCIYILCLFCYA